MGRERSLEDSWCRENLLNVAFPNLYNLPVRKVVMVVDMWDKSTRDGAWKLSFCRSLNNWELDDVQNFESLKLQKN